MSYVRSLLTFHHIRDQGKKRLIKDTARELDLCGACKVGQQGVLLVEGQDSEVDTYIRRIKALRWKSVSLQTEPVRNLLAQDLVIKRSLQAAGKAPCIQFFEDMGAFGNYMRELGLEDWWRHAMGFSKRSSSP